MMGFRFQGYKSLVRYTFLVLILYCFLAYIILSKVRQIEYEEKIQPNQRFQFHFFHSKQENLSLILKSIPIEQKKKNSSITFKGKNETYLWNLRVADENYLNLSKIVRCRIVKYDVGLSSSDKIDSCDQSSKNEFSIRRSFNAQNFIFNHQNPINCHEKEFAIIKSINHSDFASAMQLITWAFAQALVQDRIALYEKASHWPFGECQWNNPDCFFLPISNCSLNISLTKRSTIYLDPNTIESPKSIPMKFRKRSFLWYRSQLIFYLLRYNNQTLNYVKQRLNESLISSSIEDQNPYISLYVYSRSLKEYFHLFNDDSIKANLTNIFINSNDPKIFKEFEELNEKKSNYYTLLTLKTISINSTSEERNILSLLTNLYIEVNAYLHSGTLTSSYCRLIDALRLVLGKTIPFYTPDDRYLAH